MSEYTFSAGPDAAVSYDPLGSGWASTTFDAGWYIVTGSIVFIWFHIDGQSNSTAHTVNLPFPCGTGIDHPIRIQDNGLAFTSGLIEILAGATVGNLYPNLTGTNWTASGTSCARGTAFYRTA